MSRSISSSRFRPIVLFGETAGERAKETDAAQRTLSRKADDFEQHGMLSLFSSEKPREGAETARNLPPDMRQLIVDLYHLNFLGKRKTSGVVESVLL